jgi:methyl-accepting chemotaxis protein
MLSDPSIRQQVVIDELDQASVYLKLMQEQLTGAVKDTEVSVINLIECINEARRLSHKLAGDIREVVEIEPNSNCSNESSLNEDSSLLLDTRVSIALGNQEILHQLSEAFSYMQFQDVLRQRVEQIQSAITELNEHFSVFSKHLADRNWDGHLELTLETRMQNHQNHYVMTSQRETHAVVTGNVNYEGDTDNRPQIELF